MPAKSEGRIRLGFSIPADVTPGRYVIPVDVRYDRWALPQFTEAIVELWNGIHSVQLSGGTE